MLQNQNSPRTVRSESSAVTGAKQRRAAQWALVLTLFLLWLFAVATSASAEDFEPVSPPPTTAADLKEGVREGGSPEHSIELSDIQPADGPSFEVQSYEEDFGVSAQTAEQNLAVQQRAVGVVEGLEHALGKDYAGVWFDNEKGEFVVPVAADSSPDPS